MSLLRPLLLLTALLAGPASLPPGPGPGGPGLAQAAQRPGGGVQAPARPEGRAPRRARPPARSRPAARPGSPTRRAALAATAAGAGVATAAALPAASAPGSAQAEARLLAVYRLIGEGRMVEARVQAEALARDYPRFQLGQLLLGDLLSAQAGPLAGFGAVPPQLAGKQAEALQQLRDEARQRLAALQERPPVGRLPRAFVALPTRTRHAIAVDTSRHRLYLFERSERGLRLVADHYVSLGKLGIDKRLEGDQRTPVGVYFTTSRLQGGQLGDLYGSGALTLNYPNEVDRLKGRTGSGIWLHGTPAANFARAPLSTDGCIVLSNPDMRRLMEAVAPQGTPVVVARRLDWVVPEAIEPGNRGLGEAVNAWWQARDGGDATRLAAFYAASAGPLAEGPAPRLRPVSTRGAEVTPRFQPPKDLSILSWTDQLEHAVVTFGDVGVGARRGVLRRQYWSHDGRGWRIVHEAVIG